MNSIKYEPDFKRIPLKGNPTNILLIGWIDSAHPFDCGDVPSEFIEKISLISSYKTCPWYNGYFFSCSICKSIRKKSPTIPFNEAWIPDTGNNCVYSFPSTYLLHAVKRHNYSPPNRFVDAVLNCPLPSSAEFNDSIREILGPMISKIIWG